MAIHHQLSPAFVPVDNSWSPSVRFGRFSTTETPVYLNCMDSENPIVKRCADGMSFEAEGRPAEAAEAFVEAWRMATDDYEASIAAHFVARHQASLEEVLHWNRISLERANLASEEKVRSFYPSLYLNMGRAHEDLEHLEEAKHFYILAEQAFNILSNDRYGNIVRDAVRRGLERLASKSI